MNFYFCCCCSPRGPRHWAWPSWGRGGCCWPCCRGPCRTWYWCSYQPSQHQQRGHPAPCVETESRSEVKSQVCTDYDKSEVIESFCILLESFLHGWRIWRLTPSNARIDRGQRIKYKCIRFILDNKMATMYSSGNPEGGSDSRTSFWRNYRRRGSAWSRVWAPWTPPCPPTNSYAYAYEFLGLF